MTRTKASSNFALCAAMVCASITGVVARAEARSAGPLSTESFQIGNSGTVCEAQGVSLQGARQSIFDRKWALLCRDAAAAVGSAFRFDRASDGAAAAVADALTCEAGQSASIEGLGAVTSQDCRKQGGSALWRSYSIRSPKARFVVQGLAGYDSALRLALRSLVADRQVPGEVAVVSTGEGGGLGQAKSAVTDPAVIIGQGYRRNNSGAYAEAAEMFEPISGSGAPGDSDGAAERERQAHEMKVNRALQLSNLGEFEQSARLFSEVRQQGSRDPVQSRLGRNFEAIDALNRRSLEETFSILDRPVAPLAATLESEGGTVRIDRATAAGLNTGDARQNSAAILGQEVKLSIPERVAIIDAQAEQIRGTAQRLGGLPGEAVTTLTRANAAAMAVRDGRVVSITRLRAQILSELAVTEESRGNKSQAEGLLRQALTLVETQYPDSTSLNGAKARLAGFLARNGRTDEAMGMFKGIVSSVVGNRGALAGLSNLLQPYFIVLAERAATDPLAVSDLFTASQLVERPGAADTMAQLSRQLEAGSGPAADQFRQSLALGRDIERGRIHIAQANATVAAGGTAPQLADLNERQERLIDAQLQLLNGLSSFPQFRSVARNQISLDELRGTLKPGEAYLKLAQLGADTYAVLATPAMAKGWRISRSAGQLSALVTALRESISITINGVRSTYPFDVDAAVELGEAMFGPVSAELAGVSHLIFEPDGALLQLPLNLIVTDKASAQAYHDRVRAGGDEFDMRGIGWLGRDKSVSTALSAASFRDARRAPASMASRNYLGLGQNQPLGAITSLPSVRGETGGLAEGCNWPVAAWNQPVSGGELAQAAAVFGSARADVLTGRAFTDTAIKSRTDLADFRIVHFATHGLVTAPNDGCPARPALLTSFGGDESDGLLRFDEIFNLKIDADLVILSACDTASQASLTATREAGIRTGGGQALDGLVRAFIAAGGRQVVASHWPAPDDFNATQRLFTRFFGGANTETIGDALRGAQRTLMDDAETSHPFYWSGFAIIGDGSRPVYGQ